MRPIKFRAKDLGTGKWRYGSLNIYEGEGCEIISNEDGTYCHRRVNPKTIGQFIGLHDKNGNEIYEGDILEGGRTGRYDVLYLNAAFRIAGLHNAYIYESQHAEYLTIIGNIHDNPELLEK